MIRKILIIDDELNILRSLEMILKSEGFSITKASDLKTARSIIEKDEFPFFIIDVMLPDGDGIEFIQEIRKINTNAIIIMISGHASIKMAIDATKNGADDFLEKPLSKDKLLITLNNFVKRLQIEQKYSELEKQKYENTLIGNSSALQEIKKQIEKIAPSNSKVLITGESGTGKEIIAHLIHATSKRKDKPYVKINCAAIPDELIEAELFGVEKGAYTGANTTRDGKFLLADRGTLFLDEIGDMSLNTQTKVLRVLQDGEFQRVGGIETIKTDVRIIAATNKDLTIMVKKGAFREDLYFRLHVVPISIPPLRERTEDIPELAQYFIQIFSRENNKQSLCIELPLLEKLRDYGWPGNVRELKNLIERMVIMADGKKIGLNHLPSDFMKPDFLSDFEKQESLQDFRENLESKYIEYCLEKNDNNIARVAQVLNVDRTYLYKKLKKLGLRS